MMRALRFLVLIAIFPCCGCSNSVDLGPSGTVSGKLTYKGKPLAEGTQIIFMHRTSGFAGVDAVDSEGHFELSFYRKTTGPTPQIPVGEYVVTVQPPDPNAEMSDPTDVMTPDEVDAANRKRRSAPISFPQKYRQPHTSGITKTVKEGENKFEIDLKPVS